MSSETTSPWPAMLILMCLLTLAGSVVIAAFVAAPSWAMLGFSMSAVLGGTAVLLAVLAHVLGEEA